MLKNMEIKGFKMFKYLFLIISFISISFYSYAETIEIDMLNKLEKEKMVYSIKVAKIDIGDTIIWKSIDKGHNVEFVEMPEGVEKFKTKISKDAEYKFEIPGIYAYWCTPHKSMGMIGFVVVGNNTSNLPEGRVIQIPKALGMECHEVDGGDAEAVDTLFADCASRVRETSQPIFIEALTERWPGNYFSFPSMVTGITKVSMAWDTGSISGEYEDWFRNHDPVLRLGVFFARFSECRGLSGIRARLVPPLWMHGNLLS